MTDLDNLIAAVQERLRRCTDANNAQPVLEDGALEELRRLTDELNKDDDLAARYLAGWFHWYRFIALSRSNGNPADDLNSARTMFAPCFMEGVERIPGPLQPMLAGDAASAGYARLVDAVNSNDQRVITAAVDLWQRIVDSTSLDNPDRLVRLDCLAILLRIRFERFGELADLEAAVSLGRIATETAQEDDPQRAVYWTNLGLALHDRFERLGDPADLDTAIDAQRAAVKTAPADHPDRSNFLCNLGMTLQARFGQSGELSHLEAAISTLQGAAETLPADDPQRAKVLTNMGIALWSRFGRLGEPADLDAAIDAQHAAVKAAPADHPDRTFFLSNLSVVLLEKFEQTGELANLEAAIKAKRAIVKAIPLGHPDRSMYLSNLSNALELRYSRRGDPVDLDDAIEAAQAAVDAAAPRQPMRAKGLTNLGTALIARFKRTGLLSDLDAAIEAYRSATKINAPGHPEQAQYLSGLTAALRSRFQRTGALADLNDAIGVARATVDATPPDHPERPRYLSNLSGVLQTRFERAKVLSDLNVAIEAGQAAVSTSPPDHPLTARFLSNLCGALQIRFGETKALPDLDAAIEAGQAAVSRTPSDHPSRPGRLSNCGNALRERFGITGNLADLDTAIRLGYAAVDALPEDPPVKAAVLLSLGVNLQLRFEATGAPADRDASASAFITAAGLRTAEPPQRISAARAAASLLAKFDPDRSADLLESAVGLLVEVSPRHLARSDQQHALGGMTGIASHAAALALSDLSDGTTSEKRAARALRLLEVGRAVLISQALDTRDDMTDLRARHPQLAERFIELRDRLDEPEDTSQPIDIDAKTTVPGRAAEERRELADELTATLNTIRALDGFSSFGLPPSTEELLAQAASGPIVTFSVSRYRSDALILTASGITPVGLPGLTEEALVDQVNSFYAALEASADASASLGDRTTAQQTLAAILAWLWEVAAEPVLDALDYRQSPQPGASWPRIWWAPGGLLGLLPLHAAGHHTSASEVTGQGRPAVMDRVVSSYTSTIRALRYARQHADRGAGNGRSLIVAMPVTPGLPRGGKLPNVSAELAQVHALLPDPVVFAEPATGGADHRVSGLPTRANVFTQLPGCSIAHFACHGGSHPDDPSKSLLLLHDHDTAPLTVASLANIQHDRLQLVYLSACRTAFTSAEELLDESINLASAFQLTGARHVVGTLWEINDAMAVTVAAAFYRELRDDTGNLDTERSATALHTSVRAVRDAYPRAPALWAAYIHVGA